MTTRRYVISELLQSNRANTIQVSRDYCFRTTRYDKPNRTALTQRTPHTSTSDRTTKRRICTSQLSYTPQTLDPIHHQTSSSQPAPPHHAPSEQRLLHTRTPQSQPEQTHTEAHERDPLMGRPARDENFLTNKSTCEHELNVICGKTRIRKGGTSTSCVSRLPVVTTLIYTTNLSTIYKCIFSSFNSIYTSTRNKRALYTQFSHHTHMLGVHIFQRIHISSTLGIPAIIGRSAPRFVRVSYQSQQTTGMLSVYSTNCK